MSGMYNMKEKLQFTIPYYQSFRCNKLATSFDLEIGKSRTRTIEYDAPPSKDDDDWRIGIIVGQSGSGKTSVARKHYGDNLYVASNWTDAPIIENFNRELSFETVTNALTSVGFASIPSWLQPYATLSNGEKFRADLARALVDTGDDLIVFDEYTSVVDRTVAKTASFAIRKAFNRSPVLAHKKFIAVTCHYDILEWLDPDWILDMRTGVLSRRRLRRPKLIAKIFTCKSNTWSLFSQYHYLASSLSPLARYYIAYINDVPCAFLSTMSSMGHKGTRRVHRIVVLPEFQGIGVGTRFLSFVANYERSVLKCGSFTITTSNYFFAHGLKRSGEWVVSKRNATGSSTKGRNSVIALEAVKSGFGRIGRSRISLKYKFGNLQNRNK